MEITVETKLKDIIKRYPWLKKEIVKVSDKFEMLNKPIGKVMLGKVSIGDMSKKSGLGTDIIIEKITEMIETHQQ